MATLSQTTPPPHRLDVETYDRIVASGALEGRRVELLDGLIVEMSPQSPARSTVIRRLIRHFAATPRWWTQAQMPLAVAADCELEPDLAVLDAEPPATEHPRTALLVIEVALSSLLVDRNVKAVRYAQAGIPNYWLVDVARRTVEVRTAPRPNGYERCEICTERMQVRCPLDGVADLDVAALLRDVTG